MENIIDKTDFNTDLKNQTDISLKNNESPNRKDLFTRNTSSYHSENTTWRHNYNPYRIKKESQKNWIGVDLELQGVENKNIDSDSTNMNVSKNAPANISNNGFYEGNERNAKVNSQELQEFVQGDNKGWWNQKSDKTTSWFGTEDAVRRSNRVK